jgi:hypothetical protein
MIECRKISRKIRETPDAYTMIKTLSGMMSEACKK